MTAIRMFAAFIAVAFCTIAPAEGPPKVADPGPQCKDGKCPVGAPCASGQCGVVARFPRGYLLAADSPAPPVVAVKVQGQPFRNACRQTACAVEVRRETLRYRLQHRPHFLRRR